MLAKNLCSAALFGALLIIDSNDDDDNNNDDSNNEDDHYGFILICAMLIVIHSPTNKLGFPISVFVLAFSKVSADPIK